MLFYLFLNTTTNTASGLVFDTLVYEDPEQCVITAEAARESVKSMVEDQFDVVVPICARLASTL